MAIGERIRLLRKQHNLTQDDLAKKIQTTPQNIYKYEKGIITDIPLSKIQLLATALQTSPAYLLGHSNIPLDINIDEQKILSKPQLRSLIMQIRKLPPDQQSRFIDLCVCLLNIPEEQRNRFLEALDIQLKLLNPPSTQK